MRTMLGNAQKPLAVDATLGRLRHGYGRGQIGSDTDEDWFSYTVDYSKRMVVAVENPGSFGSAGLYFSIFNAVGTNIPSITWKGRLLSHACWKGPTRATQALHQGSSFAADDR